MTVDWAEIRKTKFFEQCAGTGETFEVFLCAFGYFKRRRDFAQDLLAALADGVVDRTRPDSGELF